MTDPIWLLVCSGTLVTRAYRVKPQRQSVGRSLDCDLQIVHETVSRQHAELFGKAGRIHVRDLDSRNGTFIDGKRISESPLPRGAVVRFGKVNVRVVTQSDLIAMSAESDMPPTATIKGKTSDDAADDAPFRGLSAGQLQVLQLLLQGYAEKKVAAALRLSPHTVHTHVKHIYRQLGVRSRGELMALYLAKSTRESSP